MSVKVLIQRRFREPPDAEDFMAINDFRIGAMAHGGYIGGETLVAVEDQREVAVISTWLTLADWQRWAASPQRKALTADLAPRLEGAARIRAYGLGADLLEEAFSQLAHQVDAEA